MPRRSSSARYSVIPGRQNIWGTATSIPSETMCATAASMGSVSRDGAETTSSARDSGKLQRRSGDTWAITGS
jgi:hypothetical protein